MIQLIDTVECDALHKSIVKPEAFKKAALVQDAGNPGRLFALLLVDDSRAALVPPGQMNLQATAGVAMLKLQAFRNQLYKAGVGTQELWFCAPDASAEQVDGMSRFNPACRVEPTFPDLVSRFTAWRSGKATW